MNGAYLALTLISLLLAGCSPISHIVQARFETIDTPTDSLRLHFRFARETDSSTFPVSEIRVFQDDRLLCTILPSHGITEYTFPDLPDGYAIIWATDADSSQPFTKSTEYTFWFRGADEFIAGFWAYYPQFADPDHRWLFDAQGVYTDRVRIDYNTCVGKDVIYLDFNNPIAGSADSIVVLDSHDSVLAFESHTDPDRPNLIGLELDRDLHANEPFTLLIPPGVAGQVGREPLTLRWYADDGTTVQLVGSALESLRK